MNDLFVFDQRWIYALGATLPDALRNLADVLSSKKTVNVSEDYYPIDFSMEKTTLIEVIHEDDTVDDDSFFRAGICVSWKPGT